MHTSKCESDTCLMKTLNDLTDMTVECFFTIICWAINVDKYNIN